MTEISRFCKLLALFLSATSFDVMAEALFTLENIASGLNRPVAITHANDGSGRLFITSQAGQIHIFDGQSLMPAPYLDISGQVSCCSERGLLSAVFHPDYAENGFFFVNYTDTKGNTVVARYEVTENPNQADPNSEQIVLRIQQPYSNHNGGQLQFGPDGLLYIGTGDGGSGGDPDNVAQDPGSLLGKMLRLDINHGLPYSIPDSNPFKDDPDTRDEIWALGLRNPWRFSFDRVTGDLYIADVGQREWEEVNFQSASSSGGENYGWRVMEGNHCFQPAPGLPCFNPGLVAPIIDYPHTEDRCSVTGGYVYRGKALPFLVGKYLYADYCSGGVYAAAKGAGGWESTKIIASGFGPASFGEDEEGELYLANNSNGILYKIVGAGPDTDADGIVDQMDNCVLVQNLDQRNTNADSYGNLCDPDLNNDEMIDFADLAVFRLVFFSAHTDADLDGDGTVAFSDLAIMRSMFFGQPGPSGLAAP